MISSLDQGPSFRNLGPKYNTAPLYKKDVQADLNLGKYPYMLIFEDSILRAETPKH